MSSRYWVKLFMNTLLIGGVTAGVVGLFAKWNEFSLKTPVELLVGFLWMAGVGLIFSVISQMCFFAYLTVHRLGMEMFRSVFVWHAIQLVLTVFVLVDLAYLRFVFFGNETEGAFSYVWYPILILVVALIVGVLKVKQTNKSAFIPTLFFMVVVTVIEWFPVLRVNDESYMYFMLIPLLICNTYQLLILPKYHEKSKEATKERMKRTQQKAAHS
jgi:KinB signaling pathway activation protein